MTLGKPGVAGNDHDTSTRPPTSSWRPMAASSSPTATAANTNARIVKFTKDGKYIKEWGKKGKGPGEFDAPHSLAMDSTGRLFVADRAQQPHPDLRPGRQIPHRVEAVRPAERPLHRQERHPLRRRQFAPTRRNPPFKSGIRIGSVKDGKVTAFILESVEVNALEGVAADDAGNVYGGYTNTLNFRRWVPKKPQASR